MKLYLVSRTDVVDYDQYDSMVVVAPSEEEARNFGPRGDIVYVDGKWIDKATRKEEDTRFFDWAEDPESLTVEMVGAARPDLEAGHVVCASFNAG